MKRLVDVLAVNFKREVADEVAIKRAVAMRLCELLKDDPLALPLSERCAAMHSSTGALVQNTGPRSE